MLSFANRDSKYIPTKVVLNNWGRAMIVGPARTFLTILFAAASVSASFAQTAKMSSESQNAKMSTESQAMVKEKLQQSTNHDLLVFDRNGSVQKTLKLS